VRASDPVEEESVWLIIGLGNPGPEYQDTYHNVGFRVVERLARRWDVDLGVRVGNALAGQTRGGERRVLVEPQTFMNLSGSVLGRLLDRFGGDSRLLVVSDDIALPVGRIRIRERGSAGGHNGLKSIGSALGTEEYIRVRVGILPDGPQGLQGKTGDARDYVLSRVRKAHRELLGRSEDLAADAVDDIVTRGVRDAMSKYNGMDLRPTTDN
jgi:PTH1 family peptidyl-tRNA hydrolase